MLWTPGRESTPGCVCLSDNRRHLQTCAESVPEDQNGSCNVKTLYCPHVSLCGFSRCRRPTPLSAMTWRESWAWHRPLPRRTQNCVIGYNLHYTMLFDTYITISLDRKECEFLKTPFHHGIRSSASPGSSDLCGFCSVCQPSWCPSNQGCLILPRKFYSDLQRHCRIWNQL